MKRSIKTTLVFASAVAAVIGTVSSASACGGSGRSRVSISRSFARPVANYTRQHYSTPVYRQPTCSKPVYAQPVYAPQPVAVQPQFAPQPQPQFAAQPQPQQQPQQFAAQPQQPQQFAAQPQQPQQFAAQSQQPQQFAAQPPQPQATAQPAPSPQPAAQPAPAAAPTASAEASALQMLVSMASAPAPAAPAPSLIPEFSTASAPAAATSAGAHVGTWRVNLPGNQAVELRLDAAGNFVWTASKNGSQNTFEGQYRISDGRLTLVRSADLQQMSGSWNGAGTAFTFKLDGSTNGGLNFNRS